MPQDDKDAFYVADLGDVLKKHIRWARALPRVQPFYAVKCNDSRAVVMTLASLGAGFDCASKVHTPSYAPSEILYKVLVAFLAKLYGRHMLVFLLQNLWS